MDPLGSSVISQWHFFLRIILLYFSLSGRTSGTLSGSCAKSATSSSRASPSGWFTCGWSTSPAGRSSRAAASSASAAPGSPPGHNTKEEKSYITSTFFRSVKQYNSTVFCTVQQYRTLCNCFHGGIAGLAPHFFLLFFLLFSLNSFGI